MLDHRPLEQITFCQSQYTHHQDIKKKKNQCLVYCIELLHDSHTMYLLELHIYVSETQSFNTIYIHNTVLKKRMKPSLFLQILLQKQN